MTPELAAAIYDALLPGWREARLVSGNRRVRCPLHDDGDPSLDVQPECLVWMCRAGCGGGGAWDLAVRLHGEEGAQALLRELEGSTRRVPAPRPATRRTPAAIIEVLGPPTPEQVAALRRNQRLRDQRTLERIGACLVAATLREPENGSELARRREYLAFPTLTPDTWKLWAVDRTGAPRLDAKGLIRRNVGTGSLVVSPALRDRGPLPSIGRLWDVEGESDLLAAVDSGLNYVVSGTGGAGSLAGHEAHGEWLRALRPAEVCVVGDLDDPGRDGAEKRAAWWLAQGVPVRVVELPAELGERGDLRDYLNGRPARNGSAPVKPLGDAASLSALADAAERREASAASAPGPVIVRLADVEPGRAVEWLWRGHVPRGTVTIFEGDPGLGKSALTCDLAARVSTGAPMPDGTPGVVGGAVILSAEDSLRDVIRPRLEAAGADLERVVALAAIRTAEGERLPELPLDLGALERAIVESSAVLVVIDPLMAYLGVEVNSWRDQDVRRALAPLAALAERAGCAVVIIRHLNKGAGGSAIYRGGGSIGIVGAARAAFVVAKDPDDATARVLAPVKCNLAAPPASRTFRVVVHGGRRPRRVARRVGALRGRHTSRAGRRGGAERDRRGAGLPRRRPGRWPAPRRGRQAARPLGRHRRAHPRPRPPSGPGRVATLRVRGRCGLLLEPPRGPCSPCTPMLAIPGTWRAWRAWGSPWRAWRRGRARRGGAVTAAHPLLATLRRRGVEIRREGDRLRWRAPRGVIGPEDLAALKQAKAELLDALADEAPGDLDAGPVVEARSRIGAVLLRSRRFGELWLVLADRQLDELAAEEARRADPRPILVAGDVARLRGKPEGAIRAALEVARAFPGARVLQ